MSPENQTMRAEPTPGPWIVTQGASNNPVIEQCNKQKPGFALALAPFNSPQTRADLELMALSPEMHDLLKECEHALNQIPLKHYDLNGERTDTYKLAAKIGKLLQK